MSSTFTQPQAIQNVDEFISSSEQIWITCPPMDQINLQRMGAVRMRVQTGDKNITIRETPVHQLIPCEAKICIIAWNKSIVKMFLISNYCLWLHYKSFINNIAFSSEKVIFSVVA